MVEYKDRLAEAMSACGMTAAQLATALGTSYQAVKKVLDGKSSAFTAANNSIAAKLMNVSPDWLATGTGPRERGEGSVTWPFSTPYEDYEELPREKKLQLDSRVGEFIAGALPVKSRSSKNAA